MLKVLALLVFLFSSSFASASSYVQFRDIPIQELAKLTAEKTSYSLVVPSDLTASVSFYKGLDLSPVDYKDLVLGSLRLSGLDYEIKGRQIFVKKADQIVFSDYVSRAYVVSSLDLDLSPFLDEKSRYVHFGRYHLLFASPSQHAAVRDFLSALRTDIDPIITKTVGFESVDSKKLNALDFGKEVKKVFDDRQRLLVLQGPKSQVDSAVALVSHLNRHELPYSVSLIIASLSRQLFETKGLGFAFQQGGFSIDLLKSAFSYSSISDSTQLFSVFANYLTSEGDATILSRPYIQVLDGEKATLTDGQEVPFLKSVVDQATGQSITNLERKTVGLTLDLQLHALSRDRLKIDIAQTLSALSSTQLQGASDLLTDTQSLATSIQVTPGRVYALGGLSDRRASSATGKGIFSFSETADSRTREIAIFLYVAPLEGTGTPSISWEWD